MAFGKRNVCCPSVGLQEPWPKLLLLGLVMGDHLSEALSSISSVGQVSNAGSRLLFFKSRFSPNPVLLNQLAVPAVLFNPRYCCVCQPNSLLGDGVTARQVTLLQKASEGSCFPQCDISVSAGLPDYKMCYRNLKKYTHTDTFQSFHPSTPYPKSTSYLSLHTRGNQTNKIWKGNFFLLLNYSSIKFCFRAYANWCGDPFGKQKVDNRQTSTIPHLQVVEGTWQPVMRRIWDFGTRAISARTSTFT